MGISAEREAEGYAPCEQQSVRPAIPGSPLAAHLSPGNLHFITSRLIGQILCALFIPPTGLGIAGARSHRLRLKPKEEKRAGKSCAMPGFSFGGGFAGFGARFLFLTNKRGCNPANW